MWRKPSQPGSVAKKFKLIRNGGRIPVKRFLLDKSCTHFACFTPTRFSRTHYFDELKIFATLPLLILRINFPPLSAKSDLAHFRWKSSTKLRRQRGKAQKKPIHLTSSLLTTAVPPQMSKTRKICPPFS
jgi:hypothetical protein